MISKAAACGLAIDNKCVATINNPRPDALGKLYNSQTVWYKVTGLGDYIRPIGLHVKESAASTAVGRLTKSPGDYQPPNLKKFLADGGQISPAP
jgi:hypothetical protein